MGSELGRRTKERRGVRYLPALEEEWARAIFLLNLIHTFFYLINTIIRFYQCMVFHHIAIFRFLLSEVQSMNGGQERKEENKMC